MRVLYLIDAASPSTCPTTLALAADLIGALKGVDAEVWVLGRSEPAETLRDLGVERVEVVNAPLNATWTNWQALRRRLRRGGAWDLVHAFSLRGLLLASFAAVRLPRVCTLTQPLPGRRSLRWLTPLLDQRPATFLPISGVIQAQLLGRGLSEEQVHLLRPGLHFGRVPHGEREAIRRRWGVSQATDAVLLLSDPPARGDAVMGMWMVGLAAEAGRDVRLVVPPQTEGLDRIRRVSESMGHPERLIVDPLAASPWAVLPGCEAALALEGPMDYSEIHAPHPRWGTRQSHVGLSLLWAMAGNVPVVGEATHGISELIEDRHSALLAPPRSPRHLAERLRRLLVDRQLAWQLRDMARHEAYSFFSRQRYASQQQAVYEQILSGQRVSVEPLPTTGGVRFTGRA